MNDQTTAPAEPISNDYWQNAIQPPEVLPCGCTVVVRSFGIVGACPIAKTDTGALAALVAKRWTLDTMERREVRSLNERLVGHITQQLLRKAAQAKTAWAKGKRSGTADALGRLF